MQHVATINEGESVTLSYAPAGLGMSNVYVSEGTHRYAIEASEAQAERLRSEWNLSVEPLVAFTYKEPEKLEERDLAVGRRIDEQNAEIFEHNERVVQLINPILAALHLRSVAAHPPSQSYAQLARRKYKEWLEDPTVRLREAIRFLVSREAFDPSTDLEGAPDKADHLAEGEEKARLREHWKEKIPVGTRAEKGFWDGTSERDSVGRRVRWHTTQYHSFLKPHVIPENF